MPLVLDEATRRRMSSRLMVRRPDPGEAREFQRWLFAQRKFEGLGADVLMALESLFMLGELGNKVAQHLYQSECERLGIHFVRVPWNPNIEYDLRNPRLAEFEARA